MQSESGSFIHTVEGQGPAPRSKQEAIDQGQSLRRFSHWIAVAILILGSIFYLRNVDTRLPESDEGPYLYAAWRISLGEMPYRDYLSSAMPLSLYMGGALFKLLGPSVELARLLTLVLFILSAGFLYLTAWRFFQPEVGLIAMIAFLLFPDTYKVGWVYRPDPYVLFFSLAGLVVFVWADGWLRRRRWGLVAAGLLFGLSVLALLSGLLAVGACVAFLGYRAIRADCSDPQARWRGPTLDILALLLPCLLIVGVVMGALFCVTPKVSVAVFGTHLLQGRELSWWAVVGKGFRLFWGYFVMYSPVLLFALPAAVQSFWIEQGRRSLFAWYLLSATAVLFISREIWSRHLLYLVPAICILFAYALVPLLTLRGKRILLLAVMGALLIPWILQDQASSREWAKVEDWQLADYISAHTAPDDYILADYSDMPFYSQRKTTYSGAELSLQHASSGQIRGQDLIEEIEACGAKMVILGTSWDADHRHLWDRDQFRDYLEANFSYQGTFRRLADSEYQIYTAPDAPPRGPSVNFEEVLTLLSTDLDSDSLPADGQLGVRLRWQARQALPEDYAVFLDLKDKAGFLWGRSDKPLLNSPQKSTADWLPDEISVDLYTLRILPGTPPGEYQLAVGVYRLADLSRLDVLGPSGNPVGTEHVIGELQVTRPSTMLAAQDLEIPHPVDAELGGLVRILGYVGLEGQIVRAGETIPLTIFWQALDDVTANYLLRLELRDGDQHRAGSQLFPPSGASFPTDQWRKEEIVRGRYELLVDASAAAGDYQLLANLTEATSGQPLAGSDIPLGQVEVAEPARDFQIPPISHELHAALGEGIALLGYDLEPTTVEPGGVVLLTLYWQATGPVRTSYTVFTHLLDSEQRIWGQDDSIPAEGTRPTTGFLPGEVIADAHAISVDPDAPPGKHVLEVGMYDARTGERLPVVVEGVRVPRDRVVVNTVLIERDLETEP